MKEKKKYQQPKMTTRKLTTTFFACRDNRRSCSFLTNKDARRSCVILG